MEPRRTIGELLSRCRHEPDVRDVFVEGRLDKRMVSGFLRTGRCLQPQVLMVRQVEIPASMLRAHEIGSERGRLQALARLLRSEIGAGAPVRCVIDSDMDLLFSGAVSSDCPLVMRTDVSSMEMYFFDVSLISTVCSDVLSLPSLDAEEILHEVESILRDVSLILAANRSLGLSCGYIDVLRCCSFELDRGLRFDAEDYRTRYLHKGSAWNKRDAFDSEVERLRVSAPADTRVWARGRCFLPLLSAALRHRGIAANRCTPSVLEEELGRLVEQQYLEGYEMFRQLRIWRDG